ncbi:hypothetical protein INR49_025310, partial [Caranx melampygus]
MASSERKAAFLCCPRTSVKKIGQKRTASALCQASRHSCGEKKIFVFLAEEGLHSQDTNILEVMTGASEAPYAGQCSFLSCASLQLSSQVTLLLPQLDVVLTQLLWLSIDEEEHQTDNDERLDQRGKEEDDPH